jgi:integrase
VPLKKFNFTDLRIKKLSPPGKGLKDYLVFDNKTPYLAVRVGVGSKRFVFQSRIAGSGQYRQSLGKFPALTTDNARELVKVLVGRIASGEDPRAEKAARKAKQVQARVDDVLTLGDLIDHWEKAHRPIRRPNYIKMTLAGLRRVYKPLLDRPAASITIEQIEKCREPLADRPASARAAGRGIEILRRWGVKKLKLAIDLTERLDLGKTPRRRQIFLTGEEARIVWKAAGTLPSPYGIFVRFLMSSLLRLREAAGSRWSEFSPDLSELTIPGERMKEGEIHVVWLPPIMREMLRGLPQFAGSDFVFAADGKRPIGGFSYLKKQLDKALAGAAVKPFTFHDLRRSGTTWLVRNGTDSIVADRLLAHVGLAKISAVASTYNLYDFEAERKAALERWVDFLIGEEVETSASARLMLPAPDPGPIDERHAATPPVVILGDFSQAMEHKDEVAARFICKITGILTDPGVMHANGQIWGSELAPAFKTKHPNNSYPAAFLTLAYSAAELALNGETVLKRGGEVEVKRAKYSGEARKRRDGAEQKRAEAEEARKMGREEYAREAEADALRLDREAAIWEQMLEAFITTDDPRCVENRSGDVTHTSSRAKGVALALRQRNGEIFGSERREWAAAYANAATGGTTTRFQGRPRLRGKVGSPKHAAC